MTCDKCGAAKRPMIPCDHRFPAPVQKTISGGISITAQELAKQASGPEWARSVYGDYYARSVNVYAAVKLRADALARPSLIVNRTLADGSIEQVPVDHPYQQLLLKVNPFWTSKDLLRATETYLSLWGSAFWILTKQTVAATPTQIWPVRPDRMRILADPEKYIKGYIYQHDRQQVPLLPDEVVWFRYFNPLDELEGLSPIGPLRLSADMGLDALAYNRNAFKNGLLFGAIALETSETPTDEEIENLYKRLAKRFSGAEHAHRPLVLGPGITAKNLGFSAREMEHIATLRYSLEDVSRAYQVPKIMLGDLERSNYSNVDAAERIFWRVMAMECQFIQDEINELLSPQFGADLDVAFDLSQIEALQADFGALATTMMGLVDRGIVTQNEARERLELGDPVPWGDDWHAPMNLIPVSGQEGQDGGDPLAGTTFHAPTMRDFEPNGWKRWHLSMFDERYKLHLLDIQEKRVQRFQARFRDVQRSLFAQQRADVLHRWRRIHSMKGDVTADWQVTRQGIADNLFDPDEWGATYNLAGRPVVLAALINSAKGSIADFGLGVPFNPETPQVIEWINSRISIWMRTVNEETARLLLEEIEEGRQAGESVAQVQVRIEKVFEFNDAVRSERIARTEMQNAANRGAVEAYRQSGVVDSKVWISTRDDRVRDTHAEADGQIVPLDAAFDVGGEQIEHPGEGSPENAINCRCVVAPVVSGRRHILTASPEKLALETPEKPALVVGDSTPSIDMTRVEARLTELQKALAATNSILTQPKKTVKRIKRDTQGFLQEVEEITGDA